MRRLRARFFDHLLITPGKAELAQHRHVRPFLRRDHRLRKTGICQRFHFLQALLRRQFRVGDLKLMLRRGFITKGETGIVVGQPHQPVKVDFTRFHDDPLR